MSLKCYTVLVYNIWSTRAQTEHVQSEQREFFFVYINMLPQNFILIGCDNVLLQWRMYSEDLFDIKSTNQLISMCDSFWMRTQ